MQLSGGCSAACSRTACWAKGMALHSPPQAWLLLLLLTVVPESHATGSCCRPSHAPAALAHACCGWKVSAAPFMQKRRPVGGGPSSNTWPRWPKQREQRTCKGGDRRSEKRGAGMRQSPHMWSSPRSVDCAASHGRQQGSEQCGASVAPARRQQRSRRAAAHGPTSMRGMKAIE